MRYFASADALAGNSLTDFDACRRVHRGLNQEVRRADPRVDRAEGVLDHLARSTQSLAIFQLGWWKK